MTDDGNTVILVLVDEFTKWAEAIALPDMKTLTLAKALTTQYFLQTWVSGCVIE